MRRRLRFWGEALARGADPLGRGASAGLTLVGVPGLVVLFFVVGQPVAWAVVIVLLVLLVALGLGSFKLWEEASGDLDLSPGEQLDTLLAEGQRLGARMRNEHWSDPHARSAADGYRARLYALVGAHWPDRLASIDSDWEQMPPDVKSAHERGLDDKLPIIWAHEQRVARAALAAEEEVSRS